MSALSNIFEILLFCCMITKETAYIKIEDLVQRFEFTSL